MPEEQDRSATPLLTEFGLTPLQARVFVLLEGSDGLSTSEISKMINVHRSDIYRALKRSSRVGIIEVSVGNPTRYFAIEPTKAVRLLLDERRDELMTLESKTDALTAWLESQKDSGHIFSNQEDDYPSTFRLVRGSAVNPRVIDSIQSARSEIIKVVSATALRRHYIEFSEHEKQASARGITVRMLTEIQPSNFRVAKSYSECVHLRHVANLDNSLRYLVIDGSELLLAGTVNSKEEPDRSVLSTRNIVLVRGCTSYFEEMWSKSIAFDERIKVLQGSAGSDLKLSEIPR
ncbi:MAG: hypothetical protein M1587_03775 [Thaumarchaeota archaeon]|nr:hypothetical protein [Nitrososphaerota archaeon]